MAFIHNVSAAVYASLFPTELDDSIWVGQATTIKTTEVVPFSIGSDQFIVFFMNPTHEENDDAYTQFSENHTVQSNSRLVKFVNLRSIEEQERLSKEADGTQVEIKHFEKGAWPLNKKILIFQLLEVLAEVMLYHSDNFLCEEYYYLPAHKGLQKAYERAYTRCDRAVLMFGKIALPSESVLGFRKLKASNDPKFEQHEKSEPKRSWPATPAEDSYSRTEFTEDDLRAYFTGEISD